MFLHLIISHFSQSILNRFSQYFGYNQWGQNKNNYLSDVGNFNTQTYQGEPYVQIPF